MFNEGLKESIGMTNKSLSNTDSASVSMIVNMDETEDVDVDIDVEAEHEITANMGKCFWAVLEASLICCAMWSGENVFYYELIYVQVEYAIKETMWCYFQTFHRILLGCTLSSYW